MLEKGTVIYMSNDSSDKESAKELVADVQRDLEEQNLRLSKELGALRASLEASTKQCFHRNSINL